MSSLSIPPTKTLFSISYQSNHVALLPSALLVSYNQIGDAQEGTLPQSSCLPTCLCSSSRLWFAKAATVQTRCCTVKRATSKRETCRVRVCLSGQLQYATVLGAEASSAGYPELGQDSRDCDARRYKGQTQLKADHFFVPSGKEKQTYGLPRRQRLPRCCAGSSSLLGHVRGRAGVLLPARAWPAAG
jgi:hypothetical protein